MIVPTVRTTMDTAMDDGTMERANGKSQWKEPMERANGKSHQYGCEFGGNKGSKD